LENGCKTRISIFGKNLFSIYCASGDGSIDTEISNWAGSVEQFIRVQAIYYNDYLGCTPNTCRGYEIQKQFARWYRQNTQWTVDTARMQTNIALGENYCTEADDSVITNSVYFDPTWYNYFNSNSYSINVAPNKAVVPYLDSGWSRTQANIYQGSTLKYYHHYTNYTWRMYY